MGKSRYPLEVRVEALRRMAERGAVLRLISVELRVPISALHNWRMHERRVKEAPKPAPKLQTMRKISEARMNDAQLIAAAIEQSDNPAETERTMCNDTLTMYVDRFGEVEGRNRWRASMREIIRRGRYGYLGEM